MFCPEAWLFIPIQKTDFQPHNQIDSITKQNKLLNFTPNEKIK